MNINQLVAAKIKEIRTHQGKTCQAIADDLGVTMSSYSAIENGKVNITIERLYQFSVGSFQWMTEWSSLHDEN